MKNFAYGVIMLTLVAAVVFAGYVFFLGIHMPHDPGEKTNDATMFGLIGMILSVLGLFGVCGYATENERE